MEIKGEQVFLSEREQLISGYSSPLDLSDCPRLGEELKVDIAMLAQVLDQESPSEVCDNALLHGVLTERKRILSSVLPDLARDLLDQELEGRMLRGIQNGN